VVTVGGVNLSPDWRAAPRQKSMANAGHHVTDHVWEFGVGLEDVFEVTEFGLMG
jgi:hypothetical protein